MNELMKPFDIFDDFGRPFGSLLGSFPTRAHEGSEGWIPAVDIRQTNSDFVIEVEVPGLQPDQIDVEAHDNVLTIQGERSEVKEAGEGQNIRRERRYGRFVRRFSLPQGASADAIQAQVKDGVLTIHIPHSKETPAKKIEVK